MHLASTLAHEVAEDCCWIPDLAEEDALRATGIPEDELDEVDQSVREASLERW